MPQILYFAGIGCLAVALILSVFASISLPTFHGLDFVRLKSPDNEIRLGIWGVCDFQPGHNICQHLGTGYRIPLSNTLGERSVIPGSWSRGLSIHPFVTILIAFALGTACLKHQKGPLLASFVSSFAAFFAFIAFLIDIALYAKVNQTAHKLHTLDPSLGPAFWMAFFALIFTLLGGCVAFIGHRKNRAEGGDSYAMSSKPGVLGRFF
ncbi:hypothetical protein DFH06DRAFT_1135755 [Mycena polygramma]|nr:hypothetical protein DFH06DRAFT_1135755 [Mycena polygramma]